MPNPLPTRFEIEVFRPGTFTPMGGQPVTFSDEDLSAIADSYDADGAPAPVVIGHPVTDAPAFAWIEGLRYDGEGQRLVATVGNVVAEFAEALGQKRYRKVSMCLFPPDASNNPKPGTWYAKHLGFLGAAAPAVSGLKPVALSGGEEAVAFEFSASGFRDTAGLFQRVRDFFIEEFGLERADEVLPGWEIDWLREKSIDDPKFSEPRQTKEPAMSGTPTPAPQSEPNGEAAFAEREAEITRREAEINAREAAARNTEHVAFCDGLISEGRLLASKKPETVAMLDKLAETSSEVSFAEGDGEKKSTPLEIYKAQLKAAPKQVSFSKTDMGDLPPEDGGDPQQVAFAAQAYQKKQAEAGVTISISDAVLHVQKQEAQS